MSDILQETFYSHPPERVWRALTDADAMAAWLMPNDFKPLLGHRFQFRTKPAPGFDGVVNCVVLALGDSVSIDLYPALDAGEIDVAVALERDPHAGTVAPLGAASLFYHNAETHWPDDLGDDLASLYPGIELQNLAEDGATIGDVF